MKKLSFSQEEMDFLIEFYPTSGTEFCSNKLNRSKKSISMKVARMNLKLDDEFKNKRLIDLRKKNSDEYNVNPDLFIKNVTMESSYVMGFIWADGHVKNTDRKSEIVVKIKKSDGDDIFSVFSKTGKWKRYDYDDVSVIKTNNRPLAKFLVDNGYESKSFDSACRILQHIPKRFHAYWFRGLFDGDGHISKNLKHPQVFITSSYDQDWSYINKSFADLKISYFSKNTVTSSKGHRSSYIRISNIDDCLKFLNFIYKDGTGYDIGLKRKHNIYLQYLFKS